MPDQFDTVQSHFFTYENDLPYDWVELCQTARMIGWDIETSGLNWRSDLIGTCQLAVPGTGVCVIKMGNSRPANLIRTLENPQILKVFHHATFDLSFMMTAWGFIASNIACTKIGSKLLDGPQADHTLKGVLKKHLSVEISKTSIRTSNWNSSELTQEQTNYAANDALYLCPLWIEISNKLQHTGQSKIAEAAFKYLPYKIIVSKIGFDDIFKY